MSSGLRVVILLSLFAAAGCAAPFDAVKPEVRTAKIVARYCGSSSYRATSVIAAMDGPPLGPTGSGASQPREATFCVQLENGSTHPVQVNRNLMHLRCGVETYTIKADRDDESFIVPAGETRKFSLTYEYGSEVLSGQDVQLGFEDALTREERPLALPPLVLRRH